YTNFFFFFFFFFVFFFLIAADSQDHKKEETIKPMPQKWCNLWPADIPFPEDWFKMCRGY
ncbi:PagK family vesicle-borne virulence factor, partial [Salmonella enterica]|uniref:PagK family vesicle-borne virulence factor n=1 Tax=Salmonella enterica TaxID=28901 RepID=UPI001C38D574